MPGLKVGSEEHKLLFCREFTRTFHPYEVRDVQWPHLDEANLERLRALPFWSEAVRSERTAGARVRAMADAERDPLLREAIAMQAYEESRHALLLESLMSHYGIAVPDGPGEKPRDAEWGFLRMGYGECFDSFFAFGLFHVAAESGSHVVVRNPANLDRLPRETLRFAASLAAGLYPAFFGAPGRSGLRSSIITLRFEA